MLAVVDYLANTLKDTDATPLHRQLYRALRAAIQSGQLGNGDPLPASRELARTLGLARNTVLHAYEQLLAEGFLSSRRGAGTFVAYQPPAASTAAHPAAALPPLAQRALAALGETRRRTEPDQGGFVPGRPDLQAFPWSIWWRLLHRRQKAATGNDCDYRSEGGLDALKQQLAQYLALSRGVNCQPKQIVICSGMQGALDLLSRSLADVGELAWVEEPGYSGAKSAWLANGLQLQPISVDGDGLNWEAQPYRSPRLIY
uniref:aminotransferase-like domain-containing protein n=1 Tax=Chitinimonas sp. TaxID=1934313 RepID=UPI0035AF7B43